MFTGLVQEQGTVAAVDATPDGVRLTVTGGFATLAADGHALPEDLAAALERARELG